ncbi:MAG TPA: transposase [Candidatus Binataceae bacterium]
MHLALTLRATRSDTAFRRAEAGGQPDCGRRAHRWPQRAQFGSLHSRLSRCSNRPELVRNRQASSRLAARLPPTSNTSLTTLCWTPRTSRPRRVVAKVEFHFGELFPRVGFIVTNFQTSNRAVVRFYNQRATAEQWIKEGKQAVAMTRLSCHRFRANEVRLWLSAIAYNLGNLWRRLALPREIGNWSLTSLQQRLMKTGGRVIKHARYYWLLPAESHLTRRLFGAMLGKVAALPSLAG